LGKNIGRFCYTPGGVGRIVGVGLEMATIIDLLSPVRLPIVDQTGLKDRYDIDVTYTPTPFSTGALAQRGGTAMPGVDPDGPSLFNAIDDQLGLKLQPKRMPIPVVIIDRIEPLKQRTDDCSWASVRFSTNLNLRRLPYSSLSLTSGFFRACSLTI
jgi:uncharacterized protein (TIGR03435 family)